MIGGLIQKQYIRLRHQGPGQKNPALKSHGKGFNPHIRFQSHSGQHGLNPLADLPRFSPLKFVLQNIHSLERGIIRTLVQAACQMTIFFQKHTNLTQPVCHHIINRSGQIGRQFLGKPCNRSSLRQGDRALVRCNLTADQLQQGGFTLTIAPEQADIKLGKLAQPVRIALTGKKESPGIYEVLHLLGKDVSISRLNDAIDWIDAL